MLLASKSHIATGMATWSWRWSCKLTGAFSHHSKWSSQGLGAYASMLVVALLMLSLARKVAVDTPAAASILCRYGIRLDQAAADEIRFTEQSRLLPGQASIQQGVQGRDWRNPHACVHAHLSSCRQGNKHTANKHAGMQLMQASACMCAHLPYRCPGL